MNQPLLMTAILASGWSSLVVLALLFGVPILKSIFDKAKGTGGTNTPQRRGSTPDQLAALRREEQRRMAQLQNNQTPGQPATRDSREKTARERARELYQQQAEALVRGRQTGLPAAPGRPPQPRPGMANEKTAANDRARRRAEQDAQFTQRVMGTLSPSAPQTMPRVTRPPAFPLPSVAASRRPAPPPPFKAPPPPRPVAAKPVPAPATINIGAIEAMQDAPQAAVHVHQPGVASVNALSTASLRGMGGRPAILLLRGSLREAIILKEILDRPLALRDAVTPI